MKKNKSKSAEKNKNKKKVKQKNAKNNKIKDKKKSEQKKLILKYSIPIIALLFIICGITIYLNIDYRYLKNAIVITQKDIKLDDYKKDILINKKGTYTLAGSFNKTVFIDVKDKGDVNIILNNVSIKNSKKAPFVILSKNKTIISSPIDTENYLVNNSKSRKYKACLYSKNSVTFDGEGTIYVTSTKKGQASIKLKKGELMIENGDVNFNDYRSYATPTIKSDNISPEIEQVTYEDLFPNNPGGGSGGRADKEDEEVKPPKIEVETEASSE